MTARKIKTTDTAPVSQPSNREGLLRQWEARVQQGTFSPAVKGLGTVRVMGRAGDAPVRYPCIESLAALESLQPDERAAVEYAEEIVRAHQRAGRSVVAPTGGVGTALPGSRKVRQFDPTWPDVLILSRITGG